MNEAADLFNWGLNACDCVDLCGRECVTVAAEGWEGRVEAVCRCLKQCDLAGSEVAWRGETHVGYRAGLDEVLDRRSSKTSGGRARRGSAADPA